MDKSFRGVVTVFRSITDCNKCNIKKNGCCVLFSVAN